MDGTRWRWLDGDFVSECRDCRVGLLQAHSWKGYTNVYAVERGLASLPQFQLDTKRQTDRDIDHHQYAIVAGLDMRRKLLLDMLPVR